MGSCYGPKWELDYEKRNKIYDRCCLPEGRYTLTCKNTKSVYGWGDSIFEINGERYCDDFVGFKAMRRISVKCRNTCLTAPGLKY